MSKGLVNRLSSLEIKLVNIEADLREIRKDQSVMKGDIGRILEILGPQDNKRADKKYE